MLKALRLLLCCLPLPEAIQLRANRRDSSFDITEFHHLNGNEEHSNVRSLQDNSKYSIFDDHTLITGEVLQDNSKVVRDKLSYNPTMHAQLITEKYGESVVTSVSCSSDANSPPIEINNGRYNIKFANEGI